MKITSIFLIFALTFGAIFAQENKPQEIILTVQQANVVKQEAPKAPAAPTTQVVNEWVNVGKNVGTAMREGLSALTDEANKFAGTDAGRFTMAVIAWKVAGKDARELTSEIFRKFIGICLLTVLFVLFCFFFRKMFLEHRVVVSKKGFWIWGTREYKVLNEETFSDGKCLGCVASIGFLFVCTLLISVNFLI